MSLRMSRNEDVLKLAGKLNAETAPRLAAEIDPLIGTADSLVIDMKELEYISSAGLRVILTAHDAFDEADGLKLINVPKIVMDVFEITGFTDFLDLEPCAEKPEGTYCRRMTVSDIPAVKSLIERALQDERVQFIHEDFENDAWLGGYDPENLTRIAEHYHAYLMFEDRTDTLVASGYIKLNDDGKSAYVGMLFSDPAFRHLRLGSRMLEILENDPYAQETKKIILNSAMPAFRFYQKKGYKFPDGTFRMTQEEDETYGMDLVKELD